MLHLSKRKSCSDNRSHFNQSWIGPEVKLTIEQTLPGNLSMEDWQTMKEVIAAVRQAISDAASQPPGAALDHVLSALKQAQAKTIDCSGSMDSWNWRPGLLGPDSQVAQRSAGIQQHKQICARFHRAPGRKRNGE